MEEVERSWSRRTQELMTGQLTARLMEDAVPFTESTKVLGLSLGDKGGERVGERGVGDVGADAG